jgi:hypothetical protein
MRSYWAALGKWGEKDDVDAFLGISDEKKPEIRRERQR